MAWIDQNRPEDLRVGLMHCFCFKEFKKNPTSFIEISFKDISDDKDEEMYCEKWAKNFAIQKLIVPATSAVIAAIGAILRFTFKNLARFERHPTQNLETLSMF